MCNEIGYFVLGVAIGHLLGAERDVLLSKRYQKATPIRYLLLAKAAEQAEDFVLRLRNLLLGKFVQGAVQFRQLDWLEQVINAVYFEGLQRVFVVGGGKYHGGFHFYLLENLKAGTICQADVQEQ